MTDPRQVNFDLGTLDVRTAECNRETHAGVEQQIVVGEVGHVAAEVRCVNPETAEQTLRESELVKIPG